MGVNYNKFIKSILYLLFIFYRIFCKSDFSGLDLLFLVVNIVFIVEEMLNLILMLMKFGNVFKGCLLLY